MGDISFGFGLSFSQLLGGVFALCLFAQHLCNSLLRDSQCCIGTGFRLFSRIGKDVWVRIRKIAPKKLVNFF